MFHSLILDLVSYYFPLAVVFFWLYSLIRLKPLVTGQHTARENHLFAIIASILGDRGCLIIIKRRDENIVYHFQHHCNRRILLLRSLPWFFSQVAIQCHASSYLLDQAIFFLPIRLLGDDMATSTSFLSPTYDTSSLPRPHLHSPTKSIRTESYYSIIVPQMAHGGNMLRTYVCYIKLI